MRKFNRFAVAMTVVLATGFAASAEVIDVGSHNNIYTGFTRGFSYTAPIDHTITNLELPPDAFVAGALASYAVDVNGALQAYHIGQAGAVAVNIPVTAGDAVKVIGNWTDGAPGGFTARNSYSTGTAPYATTILGASTDLFRAGYQSDIGDGTYTGGAGFLGLTGAFGRILVTVVPEPATLALLGIGGLVLLRRRA